MLEITRASAVLVTEGQQLQLDLQFPILAQVRGQLKMADGTSALYPGVRMELKITKDANSAEDSTVTDSDGRYAFDYLVAGDVEVSTGLGAIYSSRLEAIIRGATVLGQSLELSPVVNVNFGYGYGFNSTTFAIGASRVDCGGVVGDAYRNPGPLLAEAFQLKVDGSVRECTSRNAALFKSGRELQLAAQSLSSLSAKRSVFAAVDAAYLRVYDEFENTGALPVTVDLSLTDTYARQSIEIATSYAATTGRYRVITGTDYGYSATAYTSLGMVWCGISSASLCPTLSNPNGGYGGTAQWTLTIAPGQKKALLTYAIKRANVAENAAYSSSVSAQTATNMFDGLSLEERARVINFAIQ